LFNSIINQQRSSVYRWTEVTTLLINRIKGTQNDRDY
jgi:hypothetical protein